MNIKEVAKLSGVSVATVSRIINNKGGVTQKTKDKILEVIEQTGYVPNLLGRNLRQAKSNKLLAILPDISNNFYAELLRGINDISAKFGYNVLITATRFSEKEERKALELLFTKQIDGVISFLSLLSPQELTSISEKFPYVQCCECTDGVLLAKVIIDNHQAGFDATSYFLNKGHKHIGMISGNLYPMACAEREKGFKKALIEHDINPESQTIVTSDFSFIGGQKACEKMFSQKQKPTAIFAASDSMAIGAIRYLDCAGIKAGKEVEIIGFDNNEIAEFYCPSLSTIAQPRYEMGCMAAEMLLKKIEDPRTLSGSLILPHQLIHRESTI